MNNNKSPEPIKPINYDTTTANYDRDSSRWGIPSSKMEIEDIELSRLSANKFQTRLEYDDLGNDNEIPNEIEQDAEILSLSRSIETHGLQQPIGVSLVPSTDKTKRYQVIFGHRRVLAYKILFQKEEERIAKEKKENGRSNRENRFKAIKAIVYKNENLGLTSSENFNDINRLFMINVVENLHRKDLSIIEKGIIYEELQNQIKPETIDKKYEEAKKRAKEAKFNRVIGKASIALNCVADFLGIEYLEVLRAVRIKNSLHKDIIKEILEARKSTAKNSIRIDVKILEDLATLRGFPKQTELWKRFQNKENRISREEMRNEIRQAREELGLIKTNDDYKKIEEKSNNKDQKEKSKQYDGIKIVRDKQGLKIRNNNITQLTLKEEYYLEQEILTTINNFFKDREKGSLSKKISKLEIEEKSNPDASDDE